MSDEASFGTPAGSGSAPFPKSAVGTIDPANEQEVEKWATKLDTTAQQIRDAVQAVGNQPADVEAHLKGTRSTTNAEQTKAAGA